MARHRYDLVYFNIYAYAEPIKMLMAYRELDWHYHMPWDFFGKAWDEAKPEVAFGELPVLVIDGTYMLWESAAILRKLEQSGGPFFLGASPTICDFAFFHHLDMMLLLDTELCDQHSNLRHFHGAMMALPGVYGYLSSRSPLTGMGTNPHIKINGVLTPTMAGR